MNARVVFDGPRPFLDTDVEFSYVFGLPESYFFVCAAVSTHSPLHTLSPCVKITCTHVIHMQPSYFVQVRWFLRPVRAIAIRRYRDIAAVCVLKTNVRVFFPAFMQCFIKRLRHFYGGRVVPSHVCDMFCTRSPTNN
jgi:hypothetical protein